MSKWARWKQNKSTWPDWAPENTPVPPISRGSRHYPYKKQSPAKALFSVSKWSAMISSPRKCSSKLGIPLGSSSFPDAKLPKYHSQYFVGADFAGDGADVIDRFADILCDKVCRDGVRKAVPHTGKGFAC